VTQEGIICRDTIENTIRGWLLREWWVKENSLPYILGIWTVVGVGIAGVNIEQISRVDGPPRIVDVMRVRAIPPAFMAENNVIVFHLLSISQLQGNVKSRKQGLP
jgi:hypothetical protein